jgi:hypothetical protein
MIEIEEWALAEDWSVQRRRKRLTERSTGAYSVPSLHIRTGDGELFVMPVALNVVGAGGRVDLEAWPSLNRVRLIPDGDDWQIMTDSNVQLRGQWNKKSFVKLVRDLQS